MPPPVPSVPAPTRFPLYADEPETRVTEEPTALLAPVPATRTATEPPRHRGDEPPGGAGWLPWVAGFAVMALVALAGGWLLFTRRRPGAGVRAAGAVAVR